MGVRKDDRNPSFKNTLGYDADTFEINTYLDSDKDIDLLFQTTGDIKHVGIITIQSDVEERFIQTDWSAGTSSGTSTLLDSETGFLNRSGHIFHDTAPGSIRSVQFSYDYAGDLYEVAPVRSNQNDVNYINNWLNNLSYPIWECNQSQFWIYREVDISRVGWMSGINGRFNCSGRLRASYTITGAVSFFGSVFGQASQTGINASWPNQGRRGHLARFSDREFRIAGTMDSRTGNVQHSVTIDENGTEVPYDWNAPVPWALTSDFHGRLESKVFDAGILRGFGNLSFSYAQTNNSVARVYFRTGDNEADVLSKSWEGPFDDGDTIGSATTNNKQFFQYAVVTTLTDPAANAVESELVIQELAFTFYAIVSPFTQASAGTWKRVDNAPAHNIFASQKLLQKALNKKLISPRNLTTESALEAAPQTTIEIQSEFGTPTIDKLEAEEFNALDEHLDEDPSASCSSTGRTTIPWFALFIAGLFVRRKRK